MFRFENQLIFYAALVFPFFYAVIWVINSRRRKKLLAKFGNLTLIRKMMENVSPLLRRTKGIFVGFAVFFLLIAMARPQKGTGIEEIKRKGHDIFVALDVSESMNAQDVTPNRLEKAKYEIKKFIDKLQGDRIGIIAFAGVSFVQCPLTLDYGAAKLFLDVLEIGSISETGTDISGAIEASLEAFARDSTSNSHKALVLVTDGETHDLETLDLAKQSKSEGLKIFTVGMGSGNGVPIPTFDGRGNNTGYKKDRQGNVVITKLDEMTLQEIANITGGEYFRGQNNLSFEEIYKQIQKLDAVELGTRKYSNFEERYQIPLILGLLFLVLEALIPAAIAGKRGKKLGKLYEE
ncbi:VWA domain-containing protein [bacterium]|nr:VWA domain-containing protein [bacterium]